MILLSVVLLAWLGSPSPPLPSFFSDKSAAALYCTESSSSGSSNLLLLLLLLFFFSFLFFSSSLFLMKALILVGGYGTRLRPFTFSCPKPLVPFANLPILQHQIEACVKVGVKKIILAVNVAPDQMREYIASAESKYNITIICSIETEPMGTAGPIALAAKHLTEDKEPFFMFNSDVICQFPLSSMLRYHLSHGGEGTLFVTAVEDPSKYGVILADEKGEIQKFIEKPPTFVSNKINAGIYLLNTSVVSRVPMKPTSIERDIFPVIAAEKKLFSMVLEGYWMDIGQPKDFLTGQSLHLKYLAESKDNSLSSPSSDHLIGNVLIDSTAKVDKTAVIGPDVVIGPGCVIGAHARIRRSCLLSNVTVSASACVISSILGWSSSVGSHAHVVESFLGEDVNIAKEVSVNQIVVCPHKGVGANEYTPKIIL